MKFLTESGSLYELDTTNKKIRRLNGLNDPTTRNGSDGEWKVYEDILNVKLGSSVVIVWGDNVEPLIKNDIGRTMVKTTMTSKVVSVFKPGEEN